MNRPHLNRRVTSAALGLLAVVTFTACGGDDDSSDTSTAAPDTSAGGGSDTSAASGGGVTIADFTISSFEVPAGTEFTIANNDGATHTYSERNGLFAVRVSGGATGTVTVAEAGTYDVFCEIHPSMTATLTVS
jgi:plastocyanin